MAGRESTQGPGEGDALGCTGGPVRDISASMHCRAWQEEEVGRRAVDVAVVTCPDDFPSKQGVQQPRKT